MPRPKSVVPPIENPSPYSGTILDAMDVAGMFGPLWAAWRAYWKTIFALPLDAAELLIFQRHTGRQQPPVEPVTEGWLLVGRRGGKSRNMALAACFLAVRKDYTQILAPGERAVIPVIAADRKQARQVLNYLKGLVALSAFAPFLLRPPLTTAVEFTTGVTVEIATSSYRTTRGYTVVALVADEVAFWRSDESAEPDTEVLNALRGGMATVPDSLILAGSTPYARKGELYNASTEYYGKDVPDVLVWNADTLSMHRTKQLEKFVAREFAKDAIVAGSEYGTDGHVVFRSDVESFVAPEAVIAVTVTGRFEIAADVDRDGKPRKKYYAFTDPSGGSQDSWTIAIGHKEGDKAVLDVYRETQPPFSPLAVVTAYVTLLQSYGITELEGDHYAGMFPRELFRQQGVTYRTSDLPKSDLYREWLPALNTGHMELLDLPKLKSQLCGLERKVARSGQESIDHAPGGHDDVANAVCGALVRAARKRPVQSVRFAL